MNEIQKLLDNGWCVVVFQSVLGDYTAFAVHNEHEDIKIAMEDADEDEHLCDGVTPEKALSTLTDKVLGCGEYRKG